jgi:hypothetical protein
MTLSGFGLWESFINTVEIHAVVTYVDITLEPQ